MTDGEQSLRVAVVGASGRLGRVLADAVDAAPDLRLAARLGRDDDRGAIAGCDVALDVTRPDAVLATVAECLRAGVHVVVGTSGVDATARREITAMLADAPGLGVAVVPNFAVGAVLLQRFAAELARHYDAVEVVELHHPGKADAPSGTARRTAELVAEVWAARGAPGAPDATEPALALPGARGAGVDAVRVHSVRLPGLVASQEVLAGGTGELLTLRHDSFDRSSFVPGALLAVRGVPRRPGLTVGLDAFLDAGPPTGAG